MTREADFLGEWRQIRPDPAPAQVVVTFEANGSLVYTLEGEGELRIVIQWQLDGDALIITDPSEREPRRSLFRFRSRSMLVLERDGASYIYVRR
ncbi:MAG TPA: hypothetical protein VF846_02480 [Thermoanaerobaculia bacterium]|jgi:hypothetical protein